LERMKSISPPLRDNFAFCKILISVRDVATAAYVSADVASLIVVSAEGRMSRIPLLHMRQEKGVVYYFFIRIESAQQLTMRHAPRRKTRHERDTNGHLLLVVARERTSESNETT